MTGYQPSSAEEKAFLASYDPSKYPPFAVTADIVMFTIRHGALSVLLIQRGDFPYKGRWALPGGFVNADEDLETAATRELAEETGMEHPVGYFEQLGTYGDADRDPRTRVVSVAWLALLPNLPDPQAGSDAVDARWWRVDEIEDDMLAFDHHRILADALDRARAKLEYTPLATSFIDDVFTLGELQAVYETVWGVKLHRPNFRRKVLSNPGFVVPLDAEAPGLTSRPSKLYRAGDATLLHPAMLRPTPAAKSAGTDPDSDPDTDIGTGTGGVALEAADADTAGGTA